MTTELQRAEPEAPTPASLAGEYGVKILRVLQILGGDFTVNQPLSAVDAAHVRYWLSVDANTTPAEAPEQPALPPLPHAFVWVSSCMCRGPDGPCADCIARQEAYEEWLEEPSISPREAWAYARTHGAACVAADRAANEWRCEQHPERPMEHDGCAGAGIPVCAAGDIADNHRTAGAYSHQRNPEIVLYMLCSALLGTVEKT